MNRPIPHDLFVPSTWKRLIAYGIDQMVIVLLFFPLWGFWFDMMNAEEEVFVSLGVFIFFLIFPLIYEFIFLSLFQQTPGKWVLGLWVVPRSRPDLPLSWPHALLRAVSSRLSLFFSLAPFALAFFRYDRTHLVDWIAETRVLQEGPRTGLPKIRWIFGTLAILFYAAHGFEGAIYTFDSIDWESKRVDLQEATGNTYLDDFDLIYSDDDED